MSTYTVYADEAWTHDRHLRFWRFYGGALVLSSKRDAIEADLRAFKDRIGLRGEVKWQKVRPNTWERIGALLERFLDYVESGNIKFRYMWIDQQFHNPGELTEEHEEFGYFILYYFFLVLGFGLPWHDAKEAVQIEFRPDELPHDPQKRAAFRAFLLRCHAAARYKNKSAFRVIEVAEVASEDSLILQCVDVLIGMVGFMLNKMHKQKGPKGRREARTIAKEQLYKRLRERLEQIDMADRGTRSWAIGVSTGSASNPTTRWQHKFRQWEFRSRGGKP